MSSRRTLVGRITKLTTLGIVLGVCTLIIPNSQVAPTTTALVDVRTASGNDIDKHITWILAVGSDARPGEAITRTRGDALQLIGINNTTHAATSIGIPRDSYINIPGVGMNRINASLYYGGPKLLAQSVEQLIGIAPDYVFVTQFKLFQAMVNGIGGIYVDNPFEFSDEYLRPEGFKKGHIKLNGYGALGFARSRHGLYAGDFARSANQQRVIAGIQAKIAAKADDPGFLVKGVGLVMEGLVTDLSPQELFTIAVAVSRVDPGKITGCVITGPTGLAGTASVVFPNLAMAKDLGNQARKDAVIEDCEDGGL